MFCDNGKKKEELALFAPYLKNGDFVFVHDYSNNGQIKQWHFIEVVYKDVEQIIKVNNLQVCSCSNAFENVGTLCLIKGEK